MTTDYATRDAWIDTLLEKDDYRSFSSGEIKAMQAEIRQLRKRVGVFREVRAEIERLEDEPSARPYADGSFLRQHADEAEAEGYDHVAFLLRHAGEIADDRSRYRRQIMGDTK